MRESFSRVKITEPAPSARESVLAAKSETGFAGHQPLSIRPRAACSPRASGGGFFVLRHKSSAILAFILLLLASCSAASAAEKAPGRSRAIEAAGAFQARGNFGEALRVLETALMGERETRARQELRAALADLHFAWGDHLRRRFAFADARTHFALALAIDETWRPDRVSRDLTHLGRATAPENPKEALVLFERALMAARESGNRSNEVAALNYQGAALFALGDYAGSARTSERALELARRERLPAGEAAGLLGLALVALETFQHEIAVELCHEALGKAREARAPDLESNSLNGLGAAHAALERFHEATNFYWQAIHCARKAGDRDAEGEALGNLGVFHVARGRMAEGFSLLTNALSIRREVRDRRGEGILLSNVAEAEAKLGLYADAQEHLAESIRIAREVGDTAGEARRLNHLGKLFRLLGSYAKAREQFERALIIQRAHGAADEHVTLNNLGVVLLAENDLAPATQTLRESATLAAKAKDGPGEWTALSNLGVAQRIRGQYAESLQTHSNALLVAQRLRRSADEAAAWNNMGVAQRFLNRLDDATTSFEQALRIARQVSDPANEAAACNNLMIGWRLRGDRRRAIFFGKQAINGYQQMRRAIAARHQDLREDFVQSRANAYEVLAELLIEAGRLGEAVQVLDFLKEQDFAELVRSEAQPGQTLALSNAETELQRIQDDIITAANELDALRRRATLTDEEKQQLGSLREAVAAHNERFRRRLGEIALDAGEARQEVLEVGAWRSDLADLGPGVAMLHTLAGRERFHLILSTPAVQLAFSTNISRDSLTAKLLLFRVELQDAAVDPVPLARELYDVLLRQAASSLELAGASHLVWSLRGALSFVPVGALHDGRSYLVERYRVSTITSGSQRRLKDAVPREWSGVAFGVTNALAGFPALPGVGREIDWIMRPAGNSAAAGISGRVLLNDAFTARNFFDALEARPRFVHVATHYSYVPNNPPASFLLLGDASRLTLSRLGAELNLAETDLLTLSACNTALGGQETNDLEALAVVVQASGAKAVLGSLWPVSDESTQYLMREFYWRRATGGLGKAEALQQAQLALLRGEVQADRIELALRGARAGRRAPSGAPPFRSDPQRPFAHPFYWAPFVLIGNWK